MTTFFNGGRDLVPIETKPLTARYQRPQFFNITVGLARVCIAPGRQRSQVKSFLVQSDLDNTDIINVGDSHVSLVNGVQLTPGQAWVFSLTSEDLASGLMPSPTGWGEVTERGGTMPPQLFLDIADFFAIAEAEDQNLRIYYVGLTQ